MNFYERFEALCKSRGMSPQSKKILDMLKVTSPIEYNPNPFFFGLVFGQTTKHRQG